MKNPTSLEVCVPGDIMEIIIKMQFDFHVFHYL